MLVLMLTVLVPRFVFGVSLALTPSNAPLLAFHVHWGHLPHLPVQVRVLFVAQALFLVSWEVRFAFNARWAQLHLFLVLRFVKTVLSALIHR